MVGFSMAPGTATALSNTQDERAYFTLSGDLNQLGIMENSLRRAGFSVVKLEVRPGFAKCDEQEYIKALRFLFDLKVHGWWNQRSDMIKYGICAEVEFDRHLGRKTMAAS